jgi:hypothetical protein
MRLTGRERLTWKNLDTWHKKWSPNSDSITFDEQSYQDSLVEALPYGGGPCKSKDAIDRLRPIYIKGNGVDGNIEFPGKSGSRRQILRLV